MGYKINPNRNEVWVRAFIQAMDTYGIRLPNDANLVRCEELADKVVAMYMTNVRSFMKFKGDQADFGGGTYTE